MRDRTAVKFKGPEEGTNRDGNNSEMSVRGQTRKSELNRKIDHEPEGNIGVAFLVLLFFFLK